MVDRNSAALVPVSESENVGTTEFSYCLNLSLLMTL
jgi:hypothetical protein